MKFGQTIEGGPQPISDKERKAPITPEFIESVREQTGIEEEQILAGMIEKASPKEQAVLLESLIEKRQNEIEKEWENLMNGIEESPLKSDGIRLPEENQDIIPAEKEVPEKNRESQRKSKLVKAFAGLCAGLTAYAALSYGPMEKKAYAGGSNFNIGDQFNRSMSGAMDNVVRDIGRGAGEATRDLVNRMIGGGLTPQEKSRLMNEKIRLESTKAYEIQRMEIDEIRDARRLQREMSRQEFQNVLQDYRNKQQMRREILNDYRNALRNAKTPNEIKMAEEKFNASLKALDMLEKNIQPENQSK